MKTDSIYGNYYYELESVMSSLVKSIENIRKDLKNQTNMLIKVFLKLIVIMNEIN